MAATNQICQLDTITLARAVAAKELSPVEAVEAVLERLDRLDPTLHMFATVVPDRAREDAKRLEADLAAFRPDLVVLDIMLPGRDGFALLDVVLPRGSELARVLAAYRYWAGVDPWPAGTTRPRSRCAGRGRWPAWPTPSTR